VAEKTADLGRRLGARDRGKLGEYLEAIRDIERRIQKAEEQSAQELPVVGQPAGVPARYDDHAKLMFDIQVLAYQADLTRIITFMIGREGGNRTYRSIGVPDAHHGLSHHFNDPAKIERPQKIDQHHVDMLSYFLARMQEAKDGEGTLLDHSMIVYGSSLSDGNRHHHSNLPTLLAGGAAGDIRGGRHIRYKQGTPMTNLFLTMLGIAGVQPEKIGDSAGKLEQLSDL